MKTFPLKFKPENKDNFKNYLYERSIRYLRKEIYEHILKTDDWFDLDNFNKNYVNNMDITIQISDKIIAELQNHGWRVQYMFGKSALVFEDKIPKGEEI